MMKLIRLKEVMAKTGLGRTSIYNFMNSGCFPKSVKLGDRAVAWIEDEVDEWIESKIQQRDTDQAHDYLQSR